MKVQDIIDYLVKQGIEIPKDVTKLVTDKFAAYLLTDADSVLKEGQIAVNEDSHKEKMEDLKSYKASSKKFEGLYNDVKIALDSGDSHNAKLLENYKTANERLKKIADKFISDAKARWETGKESIPEALAKKFKAPEEGEELSEDDLFSNLERLEEYREVNPEAFGIKVEKGADGNPLSIPKVRKDGRQVKQAKDESWKSKSPAEKMAMGYKDQKKGSGIFPGARREESD